MVVRALLRDQVKSAHDNHVLKIMQVDDMRCSCVASIVAVHGPMSSHAIGQLPMPHALLWLVALLASLRARVRACLIVVRSRARSFAFIACLNGRLTG